MKTVGRVKLYALATLLVFIRHNFINITRAETCTGVLVLGETLVHTHIHIMDNQVGRLIFPVDGFRKVYTRQLVHQQDTVIGDSVI